MDYHPKVATILNRIQKAKEETNIKDSNSDIESDSEGDENKEPIDKQTNTKKFNPVSKSFGEDCLDEDDDLFGSDEEFLEEED